VKIKE